MDKHLREIQQSVELQVSKAISNAYYEGYKHGHAHGFEAARAVDSDVCPACSCPDYSVHNTLVTGIETTYRSCEDCHFHWRFE